MKLPLLDRGRLSGFNLAPIAVCLLLVTRVIAFDYEEERSAAVKNCEAIDPSDYQSGLFFNPDGYRSYYVRSQCFLDAAVQFRDPTLCVQVRERPSLLSSSWGYSAGRCRELVSEGAIIPAFVGDYAHGYALTFEILQPDAASSPILLHSSGYYLDANSNLRIYVRQADIRQRFSSWVLNRSYTVRATVTLDVGTGGPSGYWRNAFIEGVFPTRDRSHSITRQVAF